jgi:hypothetical protein
MMSERALAFVEEWISEHVTGADAAAADGSNGARAKALANRCLADASAQGIPASEIADAIDDLPAFIGGAIEEAGERETHASGFETDQEIELLVNPDSFGNAVEDAEEDEDDQKQ